MTIFKYDYPPVPDYQVLVWLCWSSRGGDEKKCLRLVIGPSSIPPCQDLYQDDIEWNQSDFASFFLKLC